MDLREKKTLRAIKNAFLQLRSQKPLERITVKELTELAEISKTTFYLHYDDIYALSEAMQNEVIESVMNSIPHPEFFLTNPSVFTHEMFSAFHEQGCLIDTLFSGNQASVLPFHIEEKLKAFIKSMLPSTDPRFEILLTYHIQGGFNVYKRYCKEYELDKLIDIIVSSTRTIYEEIEKNSK